MSDPNLPEGVTQKDIDRTCGETVDPNDPEYKIEKLQERIKNIKTLCGYFDDYHPPNCAGYTTYKHKIIRLSFQHQLCDCIISDILHEIEMSEDFI